MMLSCIWWRSSSYTALMNVESHLQTEKHFIPSCNPNVFKVNVIQNHLKHYFKQIHGTLTGTTMLNQSGPGSHSNEGETWYSPKLQNWSLITGWSLASFPRYFGGRSYSSIKEYSFMSHPGWHLWMKDK